MLNVLLIHHLKEHYEDLNKGTVHHLRSHSLSEKDGAVFKALGIRASIFIPVFVDQRLWGCLGLDRSLAEDEWQDNEIDALKAAGRSLGTLLARANTEEQFRRLTGNIRAVFWTSSPDGRRRNYVSPAYEQIWRQSRAELREHPEAWLDAIHSRDGDRVQRALANGLDYDQVYRIVLPDRTTRWIHDRGFPVRNELGQVSQVVGIAEDISAQKEAEAKIQSTTALLSTLIDNLRSGVLVEDEQHGLRHVNQVFCEMFEIPVPKDSLLGTDTRLLFAKSKAFGERIEQIRKSERPISGEEIHFEDQILQRDYVPLNFDAQELYHLWQYQDITDQKRAERQIKTSLSEKEVLLQEIHHRVKNNLQVVSSLLSLQSEQIKNKEALTVFKESQDRVKAMALVHERLYKSQDLANIDFTGYVQNLSNHLMRSYGSHAGAVSLDLKVEPVPLGIDAAIPCGLIINELVSNALKYAFPKGERGTILLSLKQEGNNTLRLIVKDDGIGMPEGIDLSNTPSLGLKLVQGLVQQLGGVLTHRNNNGTEFDISFSLSNDPQSKEPRSWARSG
jgi:PAS domain S-box-containing protein